MRARRFGWDGRATWGFRLYILVPRTASNVYIPLFKNIMSTIYTVHTDHSLHHHLTTSKIHAPTCKQTDASGHHA